MQFKGYHINNLKSYRKYFCFSDAVEALDNGAYQEWLNGIVKGPEDQEIQEISVGDDERIIGEIRNLLDQIYGCESPKRRSETEHQSAGGHDEKLYQDLFLLFFALARMTATEEDREEIVRMARARAEKQRGLKQGETNGKNGPYAEISLIGEDYEIQVWKNKTEAHSIFRWERLVNAGAVSISVLLMDGERTQSSRCLNPGGDVWLLTLNGCFVKWGSRVQVCHRSFACVDRKGHLTVNGYPMRSEGMVDFSFDQRTGILGADWSGNLRQYSGLDLGTSAGDAAKSDGVEKEKIAFAWLDGKTYMLVKEDGKLLSNLTDCPADFFDWQVQAVRGERAASAGVIGYEKSEQVRDAEGELPFAAVIYCVSDQLIGFETPDSRVGVWDRERKKILWMEI